MAKDCRKKAAKSELKTLKQGDGSDGVVCGVS